MTLLLAIILGLVQGLTEFLPISSSGHLALFGHWFGLSEADINFDILVHLATLAAIGIVYFDDIKKIAMIPFSQDKKDMKLCFTLVVVTIPAALVGVLLKNQIEMFHNHILWVILFLAITGLVLLSGLKGNFANQRDINQLNWSQVVWIGCAQAFAILPGISRSGMTIMCGLAFGLKKEEAARFSFLMAIPAISGAGILMARDVEWNKISELGTAYGFGFAMAFVSSLMALKLLIHVLHGNRFFYFGIYCLLLAVAALCFY